jgi:hypothetical protein
LEYTEEDLDENLSMGEKLKLDSFAHASLVEVSVFFAGRVRHEGHCSLH